MAHLSIERQIPVESLPLWMRQAQRGVDWGILWVLAACLLLGAARWGDGALPWGGALENHAFLAEDYAASLREGWLYPRWSPHVHGGYGAPIPNYTPPVTPYLTALVALLVTDQVVSALALVLVLALCVAGCGMYVFTLRWVGAQQAVLSAILYVYSPYLALDVPYLIGSAPLLVAQALLPLVMWAVSRLICLNRFQDFALVSLTLTALILTDPRIALGAVLISGALYQWWSYLKGAQVSPLTLLSAFTLGVWMSAFFLLPAVLDREFVTWQTAQFVPVIPRLTLEQLFVPYIPLDPAQLNPMPQWTLGLPLMGMLALALLWVLPEWWRKRHESASFSLVMLLCGAAIFALVLWFAPDQTWVFGLGLFCLCAGAGAALNWLRFVSDRGRDVALVCLLIAVLVGALPVFAPLNIASLTDDALSPLAQIRYEQQGFGAPVLPPGQPVPVTFTPELPVNRWLIGSYFSGTPNRFSPEQIASNAQVFVLAQNTHSARLQVTTQTPQTIPYLLAYDPGWSATLDNRALSVRRDPQTGLVLIDVPAVRGGIIDLRLDMTPIRRTGWQVSAMAWLACAVLTHLRWRRQSHTPFYDALNLLTPHTARLMAGALAGFSGVIVLAGVVGDLPLTQSTPFLAVEQARGYRVQTEVGVELLAYQITPQRLQAGDTLTVSLFWRTLRPLTDNYYLFMVLEDTIQRRWVYESDFQHPGDYPSRRWATQGYVRDVHRIPLPEDLAAGSYQILIELHQCAPPACLSSERLTFFDANRRQPILRLPQAVVIQNSP